MVTRLHTRDTRDSYSVQAIESSVQAIESKLLRDAYKPTLPRATCIISAALSRLFCMFPPKSLQGQPWQSSPEWMLPQLMLPQLMLPDKMLPDLILVELSRSASQRPSLCIVHPYRPFNAHSAALSPTHMHAHAQTLASKEIILSIYQSFYPTTDASHLHWCG